MGAWAAAIFAVAVVFGVWLLDLAFRGLIEGLEGFSGQCQECGRVPLIPPPVDRYTCWRCRHPGGIGHWGHLPLPHH